MKSSPHPLHPRASQGSTLMQLLVVAAIVLVLLAIGIPIYSVIRQNAHKADTLARMKTLATAMKTYVDQNDQKLPKEDSKGSDSWEAAANPSSNHVWYNALPKLAGRKTVGEYASTPHEFYTPANVLFVPGADYPLKKELSRPYFAIAINTKLSRKNADGTKPDLKMADIADPAHTVMFLEQGLPGEARSMAQQAKKDYDGAGKGSAKSFVARYRGKGWLVFADGHTEDFAAHDLLTETGRFPFPQTGVIWTRKAEEDPNK